MNRPRVLVLDNDKTFRDLLVDLFTRKGYDVTPVVTGEDALCKIREEKFDLATVDFDLPGWVDGIDFLKEIKAVAPETEVILLTGHVSPETAKEALRQGAFHYYNKPLHQIDAFFKIVAQALESRRLKGKNGSPPKPRRTP